MKNSIYFENINSLSPKNSNFSDIRSHEIKLKNVDYISFSQLIFYCYEGYFPDQELYNLYDYLALSIVASRLLFQDAYDYCEYKLKNLISKDNVYDILDVALVIN